MEAEQAMTSNIVVERKKDQVRVDGMYGKTLAAAVAGAAPMAIGTKLKEVDRKGDQVKVHSMDGEEQWVPAASVR